TLTVTPGQAIVCVITNTRQSPPGPGSASIRIDKVVTPNPDTDPGRFDLLLNGRVGARGVGNGGTTNALTVTPAAGGTQYRVSERATAGTNTNLRDYDSTIVCRDNGGSGATVAQGTGTSLTLTVTPSQAIVCVITNTRRRQEEADLKIVKTARPRSVLVGEQVTWTVTLTNKGPDTATNIIR